MSAIIQRKFSDSHIATDHVLEDCILQDVAQQSWERELVGKFQKRYMVNWSKQYGSHMYYVKPDDKIDDGQVTPKKAGAQGSEIDYRLDSEDTHESIESPARVARKTRNIGPTGIISINADRKVLAVNTSTISTVEEKDAKDADPDKSSNNNGKDAKSGKVTHFDHYTKNKNPDTILFYRDYEENEAVSGKAKCLLLRQFLKRLQSPVLLFI